MVPNAPACRSFLVSTLILCTVFRTLTLADELLVDDQDDSLNASWDGPWRQSHDTRAWKPKETLTLGNLSHETVTLTFTGTSVQVYGAFKPRGTWYMRSLYTIDDQSTVEFQPPQEVSKHAYNQQFYDSGELPAGNHTLTITNMGVYLWLDYFRFGEDDSVLSSSTDTTSVIATTSVILLPSPTTIITTSTYLSQSSWGGDSGTTTTSTSELVPSSQLLISISATTSTFVFSIPFAPATTAASSPSLSLPLSSTSTRYPKPSISPSPPGAATSQSHPLGMSHGSLVTLIVVSVIGVVVFALLIQLGRWRLRQIRMRSRLRAPLSWKLPAVAREFVRSSSPTPSAASRASAWAADVVQSFSRWFPMARPDAGIKRRSVDGGVRVAGGPAVSDAHAPSISDKASEKSTLPPLYKEYDFA